MYLEMILESKRAEIERARSRVPLSEVRGRAAATAAPREFLSALTRPGLGVIAEVKRASPSRGAIRPDLDPVALARQYEAGGCAAMSVLTDAPFFGALPGDLETVRASVSVPVLRKDFLLDGYQLYEARAMGADAVLLIVAALDRIELADLVALAGDLGMAVLVEVHSAVDVEVAVRAGARIVGINNRDLKTFHVDVGTTTRLRALVPAGIAVVSESGIHDAETARRAREAGADAILVGEALVRAPDPAALIRAMVEAAGGDTATGGPA